MGSGRGVGQSEGPSSRRVAAPPQQARGDSGVTGARLTRCASPADMQYDEDDDEITPDLWQEACWIVIR